MEPDILEAPDRADSERLDGLLGAVEQALAHGLEDAEARADVAIAAARQQGSVRHEGWAMHLRGWVRFGIGQMREAIEDQLAAIELMTGSNDERGIGRCLHALGSFYDTIGEPTLAAEHFEQAIEIQRRIGDGWGEARTLNGLAIAMASEERYDEAAAAFLEVAARFADEGDDWWFLMARTNRSIAQLDRAEKGDLSEAEVRARCRGVLADCDETIAQAAELGEAGVSVEIYARQCRAGALNELGDHEACLAEVEGTLPLATRAGDMTVIVGLEMCRVTALQALGSSEAALKCLGRAEEMARTAGRDQSLTRCLELRVEVCEARGDLMGALEAHRAFHRQKIRARRHADEMRAMVIRTLLDTQRAEHQLALARAEVDSLETIGRERRRMVSVIAHELRNPITTVLGLSSEMSRSWDEIGSDGKQLMTMIRNEAEDLANIVEDLLVAERIENGSLQINPEAGDIGGLAASVIETTPAGGKSIAVNGGSGVYADPGRVRQILRNLISNAVRYGGDEITVGISTAGSLVSLEVRDNGAGVPEEDREAIFEPYGRSNSSKHGAGSVGLGLATTRDLARLMGGDVVYDESSGDAVFRLTLPAFGPDPV